MPPTFGDKLVAAIRDFLKQNNLTRLGQINAPILKDIADHLYDHEEQMKKNQKSKARLSGKERNALFDALAEACGCNPREMPKRQATACGVALAEIVAIMPDVQPEEFAARAARYRLIYREAALTPSSLCAHFAECAQKDGKPYHPKPAAAGAPGGPQPTQIPEPDGWREALRDDEDDQRLVSATWATIHPFYQDRIARKMARLKP